VRASTLNGCRSELRQRLRAQRRDRQAPAEVLAVSAEQAVLLGEEHQQVLRFYLGLTEPEIAVSMGISPGTVKSTTSRGLAALGRLIQEAGR